MAALKRISLLLLAVLALSACAGRSPVAQPDDGQQPWESIRQAMLGCAERYLADELPQECAIEVDARTAPEVLGRGLHLAWTGRTPDAREMIEGLRQEGASPLVIALLTLETELGAGYLRRGEALLDEMAGRTGDQRLPEGMLLAYRVAVDARNARWSQVLALLEPLDPDTIANDRAWLSAYAAATSELGQDEALEAMLARTSDEALLASGNYLLAAWELALLRGEDMALADFRVDGRELPDDVDVRHSVINNRIGREFDGNCTTACDELLRLLEARPWDVKRALGVARTFAFLREGAYAGRALAAAPASQRELDALLGYKALLAWDAVLQADPYQAMVHAQGVLDEAPRDLDANWIKAMVASSWEDLDMLADAMQVMGTNAPLSPLFMSQWGGMDADSPHPGLCRVATQWTAFLDANAPDHLDEASTGLRAYAAACRD